MVCGHVTVHVSEWVWLCGHVTVHVSEWVWLCGHVTLHVSEWVWSCGHVTILLCTHDSGLLTALGRGAFTIIS